MKLFSLITVLTLVGCGGAEFISSEKNLGNNMAGDNSISEGGEFSSAGTDYGGSDSKAGSSGSNFITSGKDSGGTTNGGSDIGGNTSVGTAGLAGTAGQGGSIAGSDSGGNGGTTSGTGGNSGDGGKENTCKSVGQQQPCAYAKYNGVKGAPYEFDCKLNTVEPPDSIIIPSGDANTWRQCVESSFGSPSQLWCCTRP